MADKHSRFLNLERGRAQGPSAAGPQGSGARFDALEQPGAPAQSSAPAPVAPTVADRFGATPPAAALELEQRRPEDQPFVRCATCEADNNVSATQCINCGSSLDTPDQRAFNERLWQQRREEAAREAAELERLKQQQAKDGMLGAEKRQAAAAMAAMVATQTRNRLEMDELRDSLRGYGSPEDWALRHAARAVPQNLKLILTVIGAGIFLLLLALPSTRRFAFFIALALVALYVRIRWWHYH